MPFNPSKVPFARVEDFTYLFLQRPAILRFGHLTTRCCWLGSLVVKFKAYINFQTFPCTYLTINQSRRFELHFTPIVVCSPKKRSYQKMSNSSNDPPRIERVTLLILNPIGAQAEIDLLMHALFWVQSRSSWERACRGRAVQRCHIFGGYLSTILVENL